MAEAQPLVSVIMPFYNTAPAFMVEAVESVRVQTYGHWELLLVDDGSTSAESSATARQFAAGDPQRIRYLVHPEHGNHGPGASRQLALQQARGELIAFLDADDLWLPQKLEEQMVLLSAHPEIGALYGRTKYWYSWTGDAQDTAKDTTPPLGLPDGAILPPPDLLTRFIAQQVAVPCTCSIIIRRPVIEASGGFEVDYKGYYDDQMLYAKVCLRTPVLAAEACWDYYRQHPESGTHRDAARAQQLHLAYLRWLSGYFAQQGVRDDELWQTLRRQLWLYGQPQWLPQALHQPARVGKKWLLRLRWPYARILLAAACLLIVYSTVAEAALCMLREYYRQPEMTAAAFWDGWFCTGDLGYVTDNQLYVTGRKKDLVIVGGKNIYPQDLETIAAEIAGIHPGRVVAFGIQDQRLGTEALVMVCELSEAAAAPAADQIERDLRRRVVQELDVTLADVRLVERRWLLKTSSDKIARATNREKYLRIWRQEVEAV